MRETTVSFGRSVWRLLRSWSTCMARQSTYASNMHRCKAKSPIRENSGIVVWWGFPRVPSKIATSIDKRRRQPFNLGTSTFVENTKISRRWHSSTTMRKVIQIDKLKKILEGLEVTSQQAQRLRTGRHKERQRRTEVQHEPETRRYETIHEPKARWF